MLKQILIVKKPSPKCSTAGRNDPDERTCEINIAGENSDLNFKTVPDLTLFIIKKGIQFIVKF